MIFRILFVLISATNARLGPGFNQLGIVVNDDVFKARSVTDQAGQGGFTALARTMAGQHRDVLHGLPQTTACKLRVYDRLVKPLRP